jgi:hypothetical protein
MGSLSYIFSCPDWCVEGVSVFKWFVSSVTDILIAFALATLLLLYGVMSHPEVFPQHFFKYWTVTNPYAAQETTSRQVSAVAQVQR